MGATTVDRNTLRADRGVMSVPVAAATLIPSGVLVADDGGYAINAIDSAVRTVLGVSAEAADNTSGGAGAISVRVEYGSAFYFANTDLTIANRGGFCYADDNQTVRAAGVGNNNPVGIVLDVDATLGALVYIPQCLLASGTVAVDLSIGNDLAVGRDVGVTRNVLIGGTLGVTGILTAGGRLNATGGIDKVDATKLALGATTSTGVDLGRTGQTNSSKGPMTLAEGATITTGGLAVAAGKIKMNGVLVGDGVEVGYAAADTAAPPVQAECAAAFGAVGAGRNGFIGVLDDSNGVSYLIVVSKGVWYQVALTAVGA